MSTKQEWLVGRWELCDEHSRIVLEISPTERGLKVRAFDKVDAEEFVVSKTKWDGRALSFETYVRSSKWRTKSRLRPISRTKLIQELTYLEAWKKVGSLKSSPTTRAIR